MSDRNRTTIDTSQAIGRLRAILFDEEARRLDHVDSAVESLAEKIDQVERLQRRAEAMQGEVRDVLDRLNAQVGTDVELRRSVARIIHEAIGDAERERHAQLSRAVSPVVIQTVRAELRNSKDEMVEALYPITGRLVQAYVANAMRDLVAQINRRLEQNALMLRLKSWTTGRSVAELAIVDAQRLKIEDVLLIRRGSGQLIARWPEAELPLNSDVHFSGVLAAITDFADETFGADGGSIRKFVVGGTTVYLRASPMYLLAARCSGVAPPDADAAFDSAFIEALADPAFAEEAAETAVVQTSTQLEALSRTVAGSISEHYERQDADAGGFAAIKLLVFLVAVPILTWLGWSAFTALEYERVRAITQRAIDSTPELIGYPTSFTIGPRGRQVDLVGLLPTAVVRDGFVARLTAELPTTTTLNKSSLTVLPSAPADASSDVVGLRRELARLKSEQAAVIEREVALLSSSLVRSTIVRLLRAASQALTPALADLDAIRTSGLAPEASALRNEASRILEVSSASISALADRIERGDATLDPAATGTLIGAAAVELAKAEALILQANNGDGDGAPRQAAPHGTEGARDPLVMAEGLSVAAQRAAAVASVARQLAFAPPAVVPVVRPQEPSAEDRLLVWIGRNAIFFGNGTEFRDQGTAERQLDELAALLGETDLPLRIVGYTDEQGTAERNTALALARANSVASSLRSRAVPSDRLVVTGRGSARLLSDVIGADSPNRRVEFEFVFRGETVRN